MKNDSWSYPLETPVDDMFDHNHDGKLTGLETTERDAMLYNAYKQTTNNDDECEIYSSSSSYSSDVNRKKLQSGYDILFILAIAFIGIVSPILTVAGLIKDAEYFFKQGEFIFVFIVSIIELIIFLVVLCKKINHSCEPDLSNCTTNEECSVAIEKAEKEKQKKYKKFALIVISICIAIGLIAYLKFDLSYRAAINEAIESEHAWSFNFDVEKHPNYKDAQGWKLYCCAKMYYTNYYDAFLQYDFKYTNAEQDKAIQEVRDRINGVNSTNENDYYDTDNLHELVGTWYCPVYKSCNGSSITITIKQKGNTLYFNRNMIMSTSAASSDIDYEVSLPINDSFRVDDIYCTYVFDGSTLKEEFDNDRENIFERKTNESSRIIYDIPFYGMKESDVYNTSLGAPTETELCHDYDLRSGCRTKYIWQENGEQVFTALAKENKIISVWDGRQTYTHHYTTKKNYSNDDPYRARDYDNVDDFYDDNYGDFEDFDEAEDYYDDYD